MKTIFDKPTRDELINRINTLNGNSTAQWGKMNVYQMLKHCTLWEEMIQGSVKCKRSFLGRLFGKMVLKKFVHNESPLRRNTPTSPELIVKESNDDIASEKKKWITLIEENAGFPKPDFMHPFFGKITKEQVGYLAYKHADHHLRQFNS